MVNVKDFGKDHWSLLAYVEDCCVNSQEGTGELDRLRMRCNSERHPLLVAFRGPMGKWQESYGTRLKGYWKEDGTENLKRKLCSHDDWDCLDDLDDNGFIETLSMVNGLVVMTEMGLGVASKLREHKAEGGMFANFNI